MKTPIKLSVSSILLAGIMAGCSSHQVNPYGMESYTMGGSGNTSHYQKIPQKIDKASYQGNFHKNYNDLPPAKLGQCYIKVKQAAIYKTLSKKILLRKAMKKRVQVRPAQYHWKVKKILVKPKRYTQRIIPAQYRMINHRVLIKPSYHAWKKGKGLITRIDETTGEILCRVKIPAVYKNVRKKVLVRPAHSIKSVQPAVYKQIKTKTMLSPVVYKTAYIPARYTTKIYKVKTSTAKYVWRPIMCKTNAPKHNNKPHHTPYKIANKPSTSRFLTNRKNISIYGDPQFNRMLVMKLSTMELLQDIPVEGKKVYSADYVTDNKSYITPRASDFIQVLNRNAQGVFIKGAKVKLPFAPRTPNRNKANGLVLYSGSNKAMFALIDSKTDKVVVTGGRKKITQGRFKNYDSDYATGHAQWISDNQFILPDRENNELSLYKVYKSKYGAWQVRKTDSILASGSIHTVFGKTKDAQGNIKLLAAGEGHNSVNNRDAKLYELKIIGDELFIYRDVTVSGGLHHPGIHPNKQTIYAPTSNGMVDVIDRKTFKIIARIKAGKGAGHVVFIPQRHLALIVNHNDTFMTAINTKTHRKIKDFTVATDDPRYQSALQAHTGRVSPDKKYFYNFASDSGTFFRVNLNTLTVDKTVYTGGTPKQASQPGELKKR